MSRNQTVRRVAGVAPALLVGAFVLALIVMVLTLPLGQTSLAMAQPAPTPPPAGPPPSIAGEWSITRSWWRSCPGCGTVVVRTTPWIIDQNGAAVTVDRGLRGTVVGDGGGGGLLSLDGLENGAGGTLRFWYGTLRVSPDGTRIEGGFNGSERIINPCGPNPPIVTCFASAGYLNGYRVSAAPSAPSPTSPPTLPVPATPTIGPSASPLPPTTAIPPTATSTPLPTPRPGPPGWFPYLGR